MPTQKHGSTLQTQSWRNFNHETRLALHTLHSSLQLLKMEATPNQLDQLRVAEWCSTVVLRLLEAYANEDHSLQPTTGFSPTSPMAPTLGRPTPTASELDLPPIPVDEFEKFEQLTQTGQLLKIEEWSDDLGEIFPELAYVADTLGFYAKSADLPSLQTVLDRWRQQLV